MTVREEITMLNHQAAAIRRIREEMVEELEQIEQESTVEEDEPLKGRWTESAGGLCLEVQNDEHHFCDPGGWRILAFITFTYRRNAFIAEIGSGEQIGVGLSCRRGTFPTLQAAKDMVVKATGVEILEEEENE